MLKKIYTLLILSIFAITTLAFSGCVMEGIDTGGDDSGTGTDEYFDGIKMTYNPDLSGDLSTSADNNSNGIGDEQDYVNDIIAQNELLSQELLVRLAAEYGFGIDLTGYTVGDGIVLYDGGFSPFDSLLGTYGTTYKYTHKDAIRKDVYYIDNSGGTPVIYSSIWNWTLDNGAYTTSGYIDEFINLHSEDLQLAIAMIILGKDITTTSGEDYAEYLSYTSLSSAEKQDQIDEFARQISYLGLFESEISKINDFLLNIVIGSDVVLNDIEYPGRVVDENGNGVFDAEEFIDDVIPNGVHDATEKYNDLNGNGQFDPIAPVGAYDTRGDYFKNYVNTVAAIISTTTENTERYPVIAGIEFRDFTFGEVEMDGDTFFTNPLGAQQFESLIFMNNAAINLNSITLVIQSIRSFNLEVRVRYNKADGSGDANIIFDDIVDTITVNAGEYNLFTNANDVDINVADILSSYSTADKTIDAFTNNTESFDDASILNTLSTFNDDFVLEQDAETGSTYVRYADYSTDFFEITFTVTPLAGDTNTDPITFEIGFLNLDFEIVE
ncbi:MAG: hypothetical protein AB7S44_04065 [Spirochaetales bacterium]